MGHITSVHVDQVKPVAQLSGQLWPECGVNLEDNKYLWPYYRIPLLNPKAVQQDDNDIGRQDEDKCTPNLVDPLGVSSSWSRRRCPRLEKSGSKILNQRILPNH